SGCSIPSASTCPPTGPGTRAAGSWTRPSRSARRSRTRSTTCSASAAASGRARAEGEGTATAMGRRVLVTGLGTFWGGRVAQALEADPSVDVIVGLDTREPTVELDRTEFVRADESYSILARIVDAARIDTVLHTFLVADSSQMRPR